MGRNVLKKMMALGIAVALLGGVTTISVQAKETQVEVQEETVDYSDSANWAYFEDAVENKDADCFLICPTVVFGAGNMDITDESSRYVFEGALNMERGIYEGNCRMFAPFYRQAALDNYKLLKEEAEPYFTLAYGDVKDAFLYYMEYENQGRPFVLAGFSQGADMCLRIMKDVFADHPEYRKQMVACYAIGWSLTKAETEQYPWMHLAKGDIDINGIVTFNTESIDNSYSIIVPVGTLAINPLNWKTDSTYAPASLNEGACFTNYSGAIKKEIDEFTGAYIDPKRGTLKVDATVSQEKYPAGLDIFADGVYHLYDYQFFYRNLQENVERRIETYKLIEWHAERSVS